MSTPTAENLKFWEDETRAPYARTSLRAYPLQRTRIAMSACGSGKSSKGGGSKSKGKSAGGDVIVRTQALKTDTDHLATLRSALRDELGDDRDVLAGFAAFTKYDREGLALDVHFRTGSSTVEAHYQAQLTALAAIAEQLSTGAIEISGYADRNGDAEANLRLSESRTASVRSFIEGLGLDSEVITTVAYGESRPLHDTQSVETDFFDRRVIVRLVDTSQQLLTESRED